MSNLMKRAKTLLTPPSLRRRKGLLFDKLCHRPISGFGFSIESDHKVSLHESLAIGARVITVTSESKQARICVQNLSDRRLILFPSVCRYPESQAALVLPMPLMLELGKGQAAAVNFRLVSNFSDTEQLFRARFEWLETCPHSQPRDAETSIPLLVRPAGLQEMIDPSESLSAYLTEHGDVIISNSGKHVVCVSPVVQLKPSNSTFVLQQRYIASLSWQLGRSAARDTRATAIRITCETLTGIPISHLELELRPWNAGAAILQSPST